jgi:hypothetical protein
LAIEEINVLKNVSRWASAECKRQEKKLSPENLRACVGDLIYEVRLAELIAEEFDALVKETHLITDEEIASVKAWLKAGEGKKPTIKFNISPRGKAASLVLFVFFCCVLTCFCGLLFSGFIFAKSSILSPEHARILADFYSKEKRPQWIRLYHGKSHGMTATA